MRALLRVGQFPWNTVTLVNIGGNLAKNREPPALGWTPTGNMPIGALNSNTHYAGRWNIRCPAYKYTYAPDRWHQ